MWRIDEDLRRNMEEAKELIKLLFLRLIFWLSFFQELVKR